MVINCEDKLYAILVVYPFVEVINVLISSRVMKINYLRIVGMAKLELSPTQI